MKDATGLKLLSTPISATVGQNCAECKTKSTKNSQFTVKITRNFHCGPISQKVPYRIFSNIPFWKAPRVPNNIHTGVYQTHEVWKTRPKKGVCAHKFPLFQKTSKFNLIQYKSKLTIQKSIQIYLIGKVILVEYFKCEFLGIANLK